MSSFIDWEDALREDLSVLPRMTAVEKPVYAAMGLALAEAVVSQEDMPPFDNSAMDGFAVRTTDVFRASGETPVTLPLGENLPAGTVSRESLAPEYAVRIMTGAPLPQGADAVIPVEHTDAWDAEAGRIHRDARSEITIFRSAREGQHIRRTGESVARGDRILDPGHLLGAAELALLGSIGRELVNVYSPPTVAVLSTGDELVLPGEIPGPGQIRDSNRPGLLALLDQLGFPTLDLGLVRDNPEHLEAQILENLDAFDFLITSGGVSVGDKDFTRDVLNKLGTVKHRKVAMKPGKPQVTGRISGKPVFGLPGNPVASMVVFDLFVLPALRTMAGHAQPLANRFEATLTQPLKHASGRTEFVRVHLQTQDGAWTATPTGPQGSGILTSMTRSNGYAMIPKEMGDLGANTPLLCIPMAARF